MQNAYLALRERFDGSSETYALLTGIAQDEYRHATLGFDMVLMQLPEIDQSTDTYQAVLESQEVVQRKVADITRRAGTASDVHALMLELQDLENSLAEDLLQRLALIIASGTMFVSIREDTARHAQALASLCSSLATGEVHPLPPVSRSSPPKSREMPASREMSASGVASRRGAR